MERDQVEAAIRLIWSKILTNFEIDADDDFFELGGDSLQMMDMIFEVSKTLKIDIEPPDLFQDSTLKGFSAVAAEKVAAQPHIAE